VTRRSDYRFPIAPVLEEYGAYDVPRVTGKRYGRKILCPFHPDTSPSLSVSEFGFICWACGKTGDAIKLVREEEGLSFADAVARCASITGIESDGSGSEPGWGASLLGE
jgi:DNA primase